jgi:hypothetical protein
MNRGNDGERTNTSHRGHSNLDSGDGSRDEPRGDTRGQSHGDAHPLNGPTHPTGPPGPPNPTDPTHPTEPHGPNDPTDPHEPDDPGEDKQVDQRDLGGGPQTFGQQRYGDAARRGNSPGDDAYKGERDPDTEEGVRDYQWREADHQRSQGRGQGARGKGTGQQ